MVVLGVLFGLVLSVAALVLPWVASSAAAGARTRCNDALAQVQERTKRVDALTGGVKLLQANLRKQAQR